MDTPEPDIALGQRTRWVCAVAGALAVIGGLAILAVGRGGAAVTAGMGLLFAGAGAVWLAIAAAPSSST
ncbi:MAG: hypothetical protein CL878_08900 [Dehalococcoidia bacterium]|nr:hypothetical protein [Dehalococcoidia bacterium]